MEKRNYIIAGAIIGIIFKFECIAQLINYIPVLFDLNDVLNPATQNDINALIALAILALITFVLSFISDCLILGDNRKEIINCSMIFAIMGLISIIAIEYIITEELVYIEPNLANLFLTVSLETLLIFVFKIVLTFSFYIIGYQNRDKNKFQNPLHKVK